MSLVKNKMTEACSKLYGQNAYMVEVTVHSSSEEMFIHPWLLISKLNVWFPWDMII